MTLGIDFSVMGFVNAPAHLIKGGQGDVLTN